MRTYKARLCFVVFSVFLLSAAVFGQSSSEAWNGYWWNSLPKGMKLGYVMGYVEGSNTATANATFWSKGMPKANMKFFNEEEDFSNVRFGQYESGLDTFYGDFLNMSIHVADAISYVRDELKGYPKSVLQTELDSLRKLSTSPGYDQ